MTGTAGMLASTAPRTVALAVAAAALVLAVVTLVTGRRSRVRAHAAAQLLERRLGLALDAGAMATWLWRADDDRVNWDERAAAIYGSAAPQRLEDWLDTVHPEDRPEVEAVIGQHLGEPSRFQVVHRFEHPDGEERWLELRGEPVLDEQGGLLGTAGIVVDVTEQRSAAAELTASREALEKILELSPAFARQDHPDDVPARVCEAAVEVFGCRAASIWSLHGERAVPVASHPRAVADITAVAIGRDDVPRLREQLARREPVYLSAAETRDPVVEAAMTQADLEAGIIAPLGLSFGGQFLTLWWEEAGDRPELGQLAVIRRFTDQAALAFALARSRAARDEVDTLNRTLQAGLLPSPTVSDPAVRVAARYRPGERRILLGGDFYDVIERPDGAIAFVVGDVTGHGPGPAAVGAALRSSWRALAFEGGDPLGWMLGLGTVLASYDTDPELFVTACTGRIDADRRSMVVANAGHPPPILLNGTGAEPLTLPAGIALGLTTPGADLESTTFRLEPGGRLLLYTDGVVEVRIGRRSTDRIGTEGLTEWLRAHAAALGGGALLDDLIVHLERMNTEPLADDVAAVLIELGDR